MANNDKRSQRKRARRRALQALYQWQMTGITLNDIESQFMENQHMSNVDLDHFRLMLFEIPKQISELDKIYTPFLDRSIEQLDPIELAILRIGTFELNNCLDVPYRVAINEAVELAKEFGAEESHKYINGVLDKCVDKIEIRGIEKNRSNSRN